MKTTTQTVACFPRLFSPLRGSHLFIFRCCIIQQTARVTHEVIRFIFTLPKRQVHRKKKKSQGYKIANDSLTSLCTLRAPTIHPSLLIRRHRPITCRDNLNLSLHLLCASPSTIRLLAPSPRVKRLVASTKEITYRFVSNVIKDDTHMRCRMSFFIEERVWRLKGCKTVS